MTSAGGIVLCGGQSKRMGRPKAWLPFGGETMLQRVVRILGNVVHPIAVVAARDQEVPPLPPHVLLVRDEEKGRGPLAGLAAGLAALHGKVEAAYLSSCDVPFLQEAFVARLVELLGDHSICVPRAQDMFHPLAAVYRVGVLEIVQQLLAGNRLRPVFLFEVAATRIVLPPELEGIDPSLQSLRNLNTQEEYRAALDEEQCSWK